MSAYLGPAPAVDRPARRIRKVRAALNRLFRLTRGLGLASRARTVVLGYHTIRPSGLYTYSTSAALFEAHLEWLAAHCEVVPADQVQSPNLSGRPRVAITFDDGYRDNAEVALQLLRKYHLPATFYVTTGFLERDPDTLGRIARGFGHSVAEMAPLDFAGLRDLAAAGMGIGAHTHTHRNLRELPPGERREELSRSRGILEDALGRPVLTMSYPYGLLGYAVDRSVARASAEAGYRLSGVVHYRRVRPHDDPFHIPRFVVSDESLEDLETMVLGGLDMVGAYQDWAYRLSSRR